MAVAEHVPLRAIREQTPPLREQEENQLSEQVPEPATDGQEQEAPHRIMSIVKTVLLLVVTTLHVPLEHALNARLEHALDVLTLIPADARLVVILTHLCQVVHSLKFYTTSWETA